MKGKVRINPRLLNTLYIYSKIRKDMPPPGAVINGKTNKQKRSEEKEYIRKEKYDYE